jgi:D-alanyl-D-alanine carboxypeptidase
MIGSELPHAIGRDGRPIEGERNALLPWWSITKTVLAAAVLRLVDRGTLSIDGRYEDAPYTIRQLLQHTSGLNTYGGPHYQAAVANGDPVWWVEELLERRNVKQLLFRPGEGWAYSNIGYLFVRRLIEASTGSDLDQALADLVFGPMRIKGTRIALGPGDMARTLWGNPTNYDPRWVYHGLLIGPPSDAVQFLRSLFVPEFLSRQVLMSMQDRRILGGEVPGGLGSKSAMAWGS